MHFTIHSRNALYHCTASVHYFTAITYFKLIWYYNDMYGHLGVKSVVSIYIYIYLNEKEDTQKSQLGNC